MTTIHLTHAIADNAHQFYCLTQGALAEDAAASGRKELVSALAALPKAGEREWVKTAVTVVGSRLLTTAAIGIGKAAELTLPAIRETAGAASRLIAEDGEIVIILPDCLWKMTGGLQAFIEGWQMGAYRFDRYFSRPASAPAQEIAVYVPDNTCAQAAQVALDKGLLLAEAVNAARDLVNTPANDLTPVRFAALAAAAAQQAGLEAKVLGPTEMQALNMGALLAVAKGSGQEPRLVVLRYSGDPGSTEQLGLVGKGITFDSGGISIKPSEGMHEMKDDMAGAAAALAATCAIARLGLRVNVLTVLPCVENMPSSQAYRPGDVLRAANGKTIEVISTDAEGRLILADALWYAEQQGASKLVDIATLTGACKVALGDLYAGVIDNDDAWAVQVMAAATAAGEDFWRLPSDRRYQTLIKSSIADVKNSGGRYGGAITGGLFIAEFVTKPWVHIDIGGAVARDKTSGHLPSGPTGVGVRALVALAEACSHAG